MKSSLKLLGCASIAWMCVCVVDRCADRMHRNHGKGSESERVANLFGADFMIYTIVQRPFSGMMIRKCASSPCDATVCAFAGIAAIRNLKSTHTRNSYSPVNNTQMR